MAGEHRKRSSESGSALVAVLCLIFTAGLLTGSVLAMSKYGSFTMAAHLALQKSMYVTEGAAARIQYLIAADRSLYPNIQLGETEYADYDTDRFFADGVIHVMNYYGTPLEFTITDARSGFDLSAARYNGTLTGIGSSDPLDTERYETTERLKARIGDYVDADDTLTTDGLEEADYDLFGMAPLPRNAAMLFREELVWIPGVTECFPVDKSGRLSMVRLIPPDGMTIPNGSPSLFTADRLLLQTFCKDLEEEEIAQVLSALEMYRRERILLSDQLDALLMPRLNGLSWEESGIYTVTIAPRTTQLPETIPSADAGDVSVSTVDLPKVRMPSIRLTFTYPGFGSGGPPDNNVQYLEWMFH